MKRSSWILLFVPALQAAAQPPSPPVEFDRDIRPILSRNCFLCHGPDAGSRAADLRLDIAASATAERANGRRAVVPFDSDASAVMRRITALDADERMPPPETHKQLTDEEIHRIRRWIDDGAAWEGLWSFEPRREAPVPAGASDWPRSPIDEFVLAGLNSAGVEPSPPADRATWLRRVTFDLTGLPPTIEAIDAFLGDDSDDAHARVVERLLASPHYGERMAVPWLDVARYADSYGYQSDQLSPTWPWRDWLVGALNENLPYDEFLTWQLAGDLLPGASREQRLATGFNRLHRMTNEGGSIAEELRIEYVADRVHTFGTAVLGLTLECARCHDHKFDPLTQREYYQFAAFFNSIDEYGLYERAGIVPTPSLLLPSPEQETRGAELQAAEAAAAARLDRVIAEREAAFQAWAASAEPPTSMPDLVGAFGFEAIGPDGALVNDIPDGGAGTTNVRALADGFAGSGLPLNGDDHVRVPGLADLDRWTPFTVAFRMRDDAPVAASRLIMHRSSGTDVGFHGVDLRLVDGHLVARLMRHWPGNALAVRTRERLAGGRWTHVVWRYDGSSDAGGMSLSVDGRPVDLEVVRNRVWKTVGRGHNHGPGGLDFVIGQRFRDRGFAGGRIDDVRLVRRAVSDLEAEAFFDDRAFAAAFAAPERHEERLRGFYFSAIDATVRSARSDLVEARRALAEAENGIAEVMVMEELPVPRPAWRLERGRYDAERTDGDRVERGTPASLPAMNAEAPRDRLGLARWVTDPANPLTSRVAVNRLWQVFFDRGLVETSEDFGAQGSLPSHPALLDWLAGELIASGWDMKHMCRTIVLSATYRQSSAVRPALRAMDPGNELLGRGPARRLTAEMIRDLALAASGLLDDTAGGPPVSPYQPSGLWRESNSMSPAYRESVGSARYRRSLYTVWKRTAPMPNMLAFDATSREVCTARRMPTSTPMQALILLNDPQFVEAARVLGERMVRDRSTTEDRIELAFRLLTGRRPGERELGLLVELHGEQQALFTRHPEQAAALLAVGGRDPDAELDPVEVAAATVAAQTILNLDAAVWRR